MQEMWMDELRRYAAGDVGSTLDSLRLARHTLSRLDALKQENEALKHASRTRPDYDLRCDDCGAAHNVDTVIPSEIWNRVCRDPGAAKLGLQEAGVLCTLCIEARLIRAGLTFDDAEFYYVGPALKSRMYEASHGEMQALRRENEALRAALEAVVETFGAADGEPEYSSIKDARAALAKEKP